LLTQGELLDYILELVRHQDFGPSCFLDFSWSGDNRTRRESVGTQSDNDSDGGAAFEFKETAPTTPHRTITVWKVAPLRMPLGELWEKKELLAGCAAVCPFAFSVKSIVLKQRGLLWNIILLQQVFSEALGLGQGLKKSVFFPVRTLFFGPLNVLALLKRFSIVVKFFVFDRKPDRLASS